MKAADLPTYYNAVEILERNLQTRGEKLALVGRERNLSYKELIGEVAEVATVLQKQGVRFGDVVGIIGNDR